MRAGRGFRMILHREDRKFFVANAFHGSVVQIDVGDFEIRRSRDGGSVAPERETVVLGGDKYLTSRNIADRVVPTAVSIGEFDGLAPESEAE